MFRIYKIIVIVFHVWFSFPGYFIMITLLKQKTTVFIWEQTSKCTVQLKKTNLTNLFAVSRASCGRPSETWCCAAPRLCSSLTRLRSFTQASSTPSNPTWTIMTTSMEWTIAGPSSSSSGQLGWKVMHFTSDAGDFMTFWNPMCWLSSCVTKGNRGH